MDCLAHAKVCHCRQCIAELSSPPLDHSAAPLSRSDEVKQWTSRLTIQLDSEENNRVRDLNTRSPLSKKNETSRTLAGPVHHAPDNEASQGSAPVSNIALTESQAVNFQNTTAGWPQQNATPRGPIHSGATSVTASSQRGTDREQECSGQKGQEHQSNLLTVPARNLAACAYHPAAQTVTPRGRSSVPASALGENTVNTTSSAQENVHGGFNLESTIRISAGSIPSGVSFTPGSEPLPDRLSTPDLINTQRNFFNASQQGNINNRAEDTSPILSRQNSNDGTSWHFPRLAPGLVHRLKVYICCAIHYIILAISIAAVFATVAFVTLVLPSLEESLATMISLLFITTILVITAGIILTIAWQDRRVAEVESVQLVQLGNFDRSIQHAEEGVAPTLITTSNGPMPPALAHIAQSAATAASASSISRPPTPFPANDVAISANPAVLAPPGTTSAGMLASAGSEGSILTQLCSAVTESAPEGRSDGACAEMKKKGNKTL